MVFGTADNSTVRAGTPVHRPSQHQRSRQSVLVQAIISPPESSRGQLEQASAQAALPATGDNVFTADDYKKFIQGYKSQLQEHSLWIDTADIEGGFASLLVLVLQQAPLAFLPPSATGIHCAVGDTHTATSTMALHSKG